MTCGAEVEVGTVREEVQVDPAPCGKCGRMTRDIDGCLYCFKDPLGTELFLKENESKGLV